MESLALLVDMVKDLPDMAVYLVFAYFVYKLFVVGSVYGLLRFSVDRLYRAYILPKDVRVKSTVITEKTNKITSTKTAQVRLIELLEEFTASRGGLINGTDISWLQEAIINHRKKV